MKNIFFLLLTLVSLTSCSTDSNSEENSFFNLKNGNLWVYKRYVSSNNVNYTNSNIIDSVRVVGDTLIDNVSYSKLVHKKYQSGNFYSQEKECLRVDANGRLVNQNGLIYHPGTEIGFYNTRTIYYGGTENIGTMGEQLLEPSTTNIEGVDYFVYTYLGNFTPLDPAIPSNYIFYQYKEGLGLVCQHCAAVSGTSYYEDRLVSYDLN